MIDVIGKRHLLPAAVAMLLAVIIVPIFLSRSAPIKIISFRLLEQKVEQGDKLGVSYSYRVLKNCWHATLSISVYDQTERIRMYEGELSASVDIPEDYGPDVFAGMTKYIGIPVHTDTGTASLQGRIEFRCNVLHEWWPIVMELPILEFDIIKKDIPATDQVKQIQEEVDELKKKQEELGSQPAPPGLQNKRSSSPPAPPPPPAEPTGPVGPDKDDPEGAPNELAPTQAPKSDKRAKLKLRNQPQSPQQVPPPSRKVNDVGLKYKHSGTNTSKEVPSAMAPQPTPTPTPTSTPTPTPTPKPAPFQEDWPDWVKSLFIDRR